MNSKKKVFLLHSQSPLEIYLSELAAYFKSKHFYQACSVAIICFAFFLRAILSRFSYSGKNIAPQFGDFEAQRHWLEITLHLPPAQWYFYDSSYWGLDYPPFTAYVSWFYGMIAHWIDPSWVALDTSRGIETKGLIAFMRGTVLFSDLVLYLPSILFFIHTTMTSFSPILKLSTLAHLLIFPPLLLIDHSHFQYNSIMLSFFVLSITWMVKSHYLKAAIAFSISLLFKQMSLYFALPIFTYLVSQCLHRKRKGIFLFFQLAITVLSTFSLFLFPFRSSLDQLFYRIFPIQRGVFEDKVASFWCTFNPLFKFRTRFSSSILLISSLSFTLLSSFPSLFALFHQPRLSSLLHACTAVAMSFFLFSFHVHEKTILLPLMPLILSIPFSRASPILSTFSSHFFPLIISISTFSLFPLLKKEKSEVAYLGLQGLYFMLFMPKSVVSKFLFAFLFIFYVLEYFVRPSIMYPDLWTVANLSFSFLFFFFTWVYSTYMSIFA